MNAHTRPEDTDPTPTPGGSALRHPDDPLPLAEAFDRAYPYGGVTPTTNARVAMQDSYGPAQWHRPLAAWWPDDAPLLPSPLATRWDAYRAHGRRLLRRAA